MSRSPRQIQRRTAWHPLFVRVLRMVLPRRYFGVDAEFPLSQEPLRLDAVVVRKRRLPPGFRPKGLAGLARLLGDHTLISLKGSTDPLSWKDLLALLAYAPLYCLEEGIQDPARVCTMLVASRLTRSFLDQIERRKARLHRLGEGTWAVRGLHAHLTYMVETEASSDHVLHVFSRAFVRQPEALLPLLTEEERVIVQTLFDDVQQFKRDPQMLLRYPDFQEVAMSMDEFIAAAVQRAPAEVRLKGLSPAERLKDLSPEERLKDLSPEERLKGLSADELAQMQEALAQRLRQARPRRRRKSG